MNFPRTSRVPLKMFLFLAAAFITSCKSSSDPINASVQASVSDEASMSSQEDEIDDIVTGQMNAAAAAGRIAASAADYRVACAKISLAINSDFGAIRINFDSTAANSNPAGCMDTKGNIRKGAIQIQYQGGHWYTPGATIQITLLNYSINGTSINGVRSLSNITDGEHPLIQMWTVNATHGYTFSDNTHAERTVTKTKSWDILQGTVNVSQTSGELTAVAGTDRHSQIYTVMITSDLVYTALCVSENKTFMPVSGTEVVTINPNLGAVQLTFDFGSGKCDNSVSVTYKGKTDAITVQ